MRLILLAAVVIVLQRIAELRIARRNEAWARAQGAVEQGAGHYPLFFLLHIGWLLAWPVEAVLRGAGLSSRWPLWLLGFLLAQVLRYQAIHTLGRRWNTRILVIPGLPPVRRGIYRRLRHPNYLAVAMELLCLPMIFDARVTAGVATLLNALLLLGLRIPAENRALRALAGEDA